MAIASNNTARRNFNPRSHAGSDDNVIKEIKAAKISIHAPTRGATAVVFAGAVLLKFQSTLPRGERQGPCFITSILPVFQSTLPRGERPSPSRRKGACYMISIHAPTRGATACEENAVFLVAISIHAPTRGATKALSVLANGFFISIHAPTRGATRRVGRCCSSSIFQSTLPRGERLGRLFRR